MLPLCSDYSANAFVSLHQWIFWLIVFLIVLQGFFVSQQSGCKDTVATNVVHAKMYFDVFRFFFDLLKVIPSCKQEDLFN